MEPRNRDTSGNQENSDADPGRRGSEGRSVPGNDPSGGDKNSSPFPQDSLQSKLRDLANPLLEVSPDVPYRSITVEQIREAIPVLLKQAKAAVKEIVKLKDDQRTFENTMKAFDSITDELDFALGVSRRMANLVGGTEFVSAYTDIQPEISQFKQDLYRRRKLYRAIKEYSKTDNAKALRGEENTYLSTRLEKFSRSGAAFGRKKREKLAKIERALGELIRKHETNNEQAYAAFELPVTDRERLRGLPHYDKDPDRRDPDTWILKLGDHRIVSERAGDRSLRKDMVKGLVSRGGPGEYDNTSIVLAIRELREELAKLPWL